MEKHNIAIYVPFTKSDDEQRMVFGYCTSESRDSQGEIILHKAIVDAWEKYMEYGNIREMHQPSAVGVTKEYTHDDKGTYIGVKVVDDRAWKFVKEGVYKGFSIGGRVTKKNGNVIESLILSEISLVDRPANPDARFSVTKVDEGLVDQLQLEANQVIHYMKKFVEIDGVKYKEDPNKPGEALLDETTGEKVALTDAEIEELRGGGGGKSAEEIKAEEDEKARVEAEEKAKADAEAQEKADADAKAEADRKAAEEAAGGSGAGGGESGEDNGQKSVKSEFMKKAEAAGILSKDSDGVLLLADLLSHVEFVIACRVGDGKDITALSTVKDAIMGAIQTESGESAADKGAGTGDLQKMLGSELSKAIGPMMEKLTGVGNEVTELAKRVESIENTRISQRPKNAQAVEKGFENGSGSSDKSLAEKRQAVEDITKEIDEFSKTEGARVKSDPSLTASFMAKSAELHDKLSKAKREVAEAFMQA